MAGVTQFQVVTDPVELWSAPDSRAREEKKYFDENFGAFFRTEMVIVTSKNDSSWQYISDGDTNPLFGTTFGPILRMDVLQEILKLQTSIMNLKVYSQKLKRNITLLDICFAPLQPDNNNCSVMSLLNYFQNDNATLFKIDQDEMGEVSANYLNHFTICTGNPLTINDSMQGGIGASCFGDFGGPINPWVVLGGFNKIVIENSSAPAYGNASAAVLTFPVNNIKTNKDHMEMVLLWEKEYLKLLSEFKNDIIHVDYSAERSIEDEISRESNSDVLTIIISYAVMFAYVSCTLGNIRSLKTILIDVKISLGLAGVLIVLISVVSSVGFYSFLHIPATLIIIEVVPFLVLAVGVDNIFILVQTFQRLPLNTSIEERIGRTLSKVGPSILLTSTAESFAFFLAAVTTMPAVRVFSLYAAMAVVIDFLLQITVFISLMFLDARRHEAQRLDVVCCIVSKNSNIGHKHQAGLIFTLVDKFARLVLSSIGRFIIFVMFMGWACYCVSASIKIEIGLDQSLSMPSDSYVINYFNAMNKYLSAGSPVYFVVRGGHNYSSIEGQNFVCGGRGCPPDSLLGQVYDATNMAECSYINNPPTSWLDDYFDWVNPQSSCCRYYKNNNTFCRSNATSDECIKCLSMSESRSRINGSKFTDFLPWFLEDNPSTSCPKGGHAAYGSAVKIVNGSIGATYFMTYHSVLNTSEKFTAAMNYARQMCDNISATIAGNSTKNKKHIVFPYSVFYVFYEQYLTIKDATALNICITFIAVFFVSFILLGFDFWTASIVIFTNGMIVLSMFGMMYLWSISLNAISLVNMIMAMGISVEFTAHIARTFAMTYRLKTRVQRAHYSLVHMGSSVFSGITLTKLGGIIVLAFSKSQLFHTFYFRMYLSMLVFGAIHGLVFLPVLLSYCGPPINQVRISAENVNEDLNDEDDDSRDDSILDDHQNIYSGN